jgi:hypothetical protein
MKNQLSATGQVRFNVLWLSPTVFISPLQFEKSSTLAYDYSVRLYVQARKLGESCNLNVHSISSFNVGVQQEGPSLLPFGFLRSMTTRLPDNFFSDVYLFQRDIPRHFASTFSRSFLHILQDGNRVNDAVVEPFVHF